MDELIKNRDLQKLDKLDLLDMTFSQMEQYFSSIGEASFRAKQLFRWIYKNETFSFLEMTDLSKSLRAKLEEQAFITQLKLGERQISKDGTQKLLFELHDKKQVECVLIPDGKRVTLCISSQVGCALGCRFCYTATMGAGRDLSVAEYMGQFLGASALLEDEQRITNVVFMGMGEPLLNFDNLIQTLSIMTDKQGLALASRRLTVSTAGICPKIEQLAEVMPIRLAISLHATTDAQRDELMPINKRYNIKRLFESLEKFRVIQDNHRLPITLEYILMDGINDTDDDAKRLLKLARKVQGKINLIPYNEHDGAPYKRPSKQKIEHFHQLLQRTAVRATKRTTRGEDISAACGQLAIASKTNKK